jgi:hypothetical protein
VWKRGEWVIRVYFLKCSSKHGLIWDYKHRWRRRGVTGANESAILAVVLANQRQLLVEWNEKVCDPRNKKDVKHEHKKKSGGARRG